MEKIRKRINIRLFWLKCHSMKEQKAILLLLLTSLIWGLAFVAQSVSSESIGPFTFNGIRMLIGAVVLLPFAIPLIRKHKGDKDYLKNAIKGGILCGICLGAAAVTQQFGVAASGAGKGGFITSLYIVIVPFMSLALGQKIRKAVWLSALIAMIGMYLLSIGEGFTISQGDIYLIICAVLFALHIMVIDRTGKNTDGIVLSMFQFLTAGILCIIGMMLFENPDMGAILDAWLPIIYAGAFSCGIAYTLQVVAQKYVRPSRAVFALSLESVWAAIGGALILSERLSGREIIGCALVFAAVLIAEIEPQKSST